MNDDKIPKIINYCWFGKNKKNKLIIKCIKSWKKYCPDYEIVEWNEENFDINCNKYVKEAYENKKWAFVSDYARLYAVYIRGGFYLDTDVELLKTLDGLRKYEHVFAFENDENINTGIGFGAIKGSKIIKKLLDSYSNITFIKDNGKMDLTPCTHRNTQTFNELYENIADYKNEIIDNSIFLDKEYFCPFNATTGTLKKTNNTYGIHWYNASWRSKKINIREKILRPIKRIVGVERFNKLKGKGK